MVTLGNSINFYYDVNAIVANLGYIVYNLADGYFWKF
jgi:hypothetical protein